MKHDLSPEYRIVQLESIHAAYLSELATVFSEAFECPHQKPPQEGDLASFLSNPAYIVLIAQDGTDAIVGGIVAYELVKFESGIREIYLYDIAVAPSHRRKGIATALVERLRIIASERGATVIFLQAEHGDDAAFAFYRARGMRETPVSQFEVAIASDDMAKRLGKE